MSDYARDFMLKSEREDFERKRRNRLFVAACALAYLAGVLTMYFFGG